MEVLMVETIEYLKDYISLLESQIPKRDDIYRKYVEKKVDKIKCQIELLKDM